MFRRCLRNRSFCTCVHTQAPNDIMQKVRKMTRALFKVQRDTRQVRLLLDSGKPFVNQGWEFTFEDVRHTVKRDSSADPVGPHSILSRFDHYTLPRSLLWF